MAILNQDSKFITYGQMNLSNYLSKLWLDLAMWTREFVVSDAFDLGDLEAVGLRLYDVPNEFMDAFEMLFGTETAQRMLGLLTAHVVAVVEITRAQKLGNVEGADAALVRLYENSDEIASFLGQINPYWQEQVWKDLLYGYNRSINDEIIAVLAGAYEVAIIIYESLQNQASRMADYMTRGFIDYFLP